MLATKLVVKDATKFAVNFAVILPAGQTRGK
jgi:hypothetical protein